MSEWRSLGDDERSEDLLSFDITQNYLLGENANAEPRWNSFGVNINLMGDKALGLSDVVSIGFGLRFAFNNMRSDAYLHIIDSIGATRLDLIPDSLTIERHKFTTNFIELPLELRFRFDGMDRSYRITLGGVVGRRMRSFEQWRVGDLRFREYNHPDVNKWRFGAFLRVGTEHMAVYAGYYFNPIFKNAQSSQVNLFNFGLNIAF
jgi:hypothetical protein